MSLELDGTVAVDANAGCNLKWSYWDGQEQFCPAEQKDCPGIIAAGSSRTFKEQTISANGTDYLYLIPQLHPVSIAIDRLKESRVTLTHCPKNDHDAAVFSITGNKNFSSGVPAGTFTNSTIINKTGDPLLSYGFYDSAAGRFNPDSPSGTFTGSVPINIQGISKYPLAVSYGPNVIMFSALAGVNVGIDFSGRVRALVMTIEDPPLVQIATPPSPGIFCISETGLILIILVLILLFWLCRNIKCRKA